MQTSFGQATTPGPGTFSAIRAESASSPNASNTSTSNSATVSANDFLQLLVTEMKNQDPTANTDPNEYINQLVQVNSLEQLVQINQDLGGASSTNSNSRTSGSVTTAPQNTENAAMQKIAGSASGNLAQPADSAAALRVARALQVPETKIASPDLPGFPRSSSPWREGTGTAVSTAR